MLCISLCWHYITQNYFETPQTAVNWTILYYCNSEKSKVKNARIIQHTFKLNHLGHSKKFRTTKPIQCETAALQNLPTPRNKLNLMLFIGSKNFYTDYNGKLPVNMKLSDLFHESIIFIRNNDLEALFQNIITSITKDVSLMLPKSKHIFLSLRIPP